MELIDTHAHLTTPVLLNRLPQVLARAADGGVRTIISVAGNLEDAVRIAALTEAHAGVYGTVGIHPHEAENVEHDAVQRLPELADRPGVVAIGEIGLDYYYEFAERRVQRDLLRAQLDAAAGLSLPVIIHCREAFADVLALLEGSGFAQRPVVFHCFAGNEAEAAVILERGWSLSFTGMVTFRNAAAVQAVARTCPLERMMLETDSPYLSPQPVRSVRPNEPAHLVHVADFVAHLRSISVDELAAATTANARRFFGLPGPS